MHSGYILLQLATFINFVYFEFVFTCLVKVYIVLNYKSE